MREDSEHQILQSVRVKGKQVMTAELGTVIRVK